MAEPARAPDGERLAALEPRLRLLLQHLAGRALRARLDLDDLAQETFARVLAAPGGLPGPSPDDAELWRFLAAHARRATVDAARRLRAAKRDGLAEPLLRGDTRSPGVRESRVPQRAPGPATEAAARGEVERLTAAFARLAPDHRRVIGLRQLEGLDAREAGRRMGRSATAVHSLYRRALEAWEAALRG
jgi:RNA polymerase sigma factor (sigma-70 family)